MTILEISVATIAFFIVLFVIGLLIALVQVKRMAKEAEKLMETSRFHIAPISHDLTIIVNDVKRIVQSIQKQMGMVEQGVGDVKDTVTRITQFEKELQEKLHQPVIEFATLISAVSKALRAFLDIWKRKK
ncbi:DUF948 domain-containing protein [candidate division KSB1 bacterium]|nr:DUF948 domain-containing protein [candidate division KSB1 bacterium]